MGPLIEVLPIRVIQNKSPDNDSLDDSSSDKSFDTSILFSRLQNLCLKARVTECSFESCQAIRRRLESVVPPCNAWPNFRNWFLTASACQISLITNDFLWLSLFTIQHAMFMFDDLWQEMQDPQNEDLAFEISEIFWFYRTYIQPSLTISNDKYRDPRGILAKERQLPSMSFDFDQKLYYKASQRALAAAIALKICRKRLWDLIFMAERRHGDISAIMSIVQSSSNPAMFAHKGHDDCTPEYCELANENSTVKRQLHKCPGQSCGSVRFPVRKIVKIILDGRRIAWKMTKRPKGIMMPKVFMRPELVGIADRDINNEIHASKTLAISHVWSDGTGVGVKRPGEVNKCLVAFFFDVARELGCSELWWDAICVPTAESEEEKKARRIAISQMHENFADAKHVLIHDEYLLQVDWAEDGSPAVALVLSPWFSRGWTALELSVARSVKVMYRDPKNRNGYVIKDLGKDVLAHRSFERLGHIAASKLTQRLVGQPPSLMDLITIMSTRSTSWDRDRLAIAALLARVKDFDYNTSRAEATRQILQQYSSFDISLLHHEQANIVDQGPFSWCPSNILLNPRELLTHWSPVAGDYTSQAQLCASNEEYGSVRGSWECTILRERTVHQIKPLSMHLNIYKAIGEIPPESLVVLHPQSSRLPDLLVVATGLWSSGSSFWIECHYIGCVRTELKSDETLTISQQLQKRGPFRFKLGTEMKKKPCPAKPLLEHTRREDDLLIEYLEESDSSQC